MRTEASWPEVTKEFDNLKAFSRSLCVIRLQSSSGDVDWSWQQGDRDAVLVRARFSLASARALGLLKESSSPVGPDVEVSGQDIFRDSYSDSVDNVSKRWLDLASGIAAVQERHSLAAVFEEFLATDDVAERVYEKSLKWATASGPAPRLRLEVHSTLHPEGNLGTWSSELKDACDVSLIACARMETASVVLEGRLAEKKAATLAQPTGPTAAPPVATTRVTVLPEPPGVAHGRPREEDPFVTRGLREVAVARFKEANGLSKVDAIAAKIGVHRADLYAWQRDRSKQRPKIESALAVSLPAV